MSVITTIIGAIALFGGIALFWAALTTAFIPQATLYAVLSVAAFVFAGVMLIASKLDDK